MGLNFEKLKKERQRIHEELKQDRFSKLPVEVIHLLNNEVINHVLHHIKVSKSEDIPARVLNNWIEKKAIVIDEQDKGKVKRFNKIHCIWLNIIAEARKLGLHLEDLEAAHQKEMTSEIPNFSYVKLGIINTILNKPHIIELSQGGIFEIMYQEEYRTFFNKGNMYYPHSILPLTSLVQQEFPKSNFELPLEIENVTSDEEKMLLLFLLKSGAYGYMKVYLSETDIRLIEGSDAVIANEEVKKAISTWKFHKIEIMLEDETMTIIEGNL
ncbi:hypothetical protein PG291_02470 [Riemerella anatipestifer]|nr:hypothetical protein [Riemerella anatipestifer]